MLVLSRQRDETIMIGDDIELTVVDIRGDKVRLGIKAPPRTNRRPVPPRAIWQRFAIALSRIPPSASVPAAPQAPADSRANPTNRSAKAHECSE